MCDEAASFRFVSRPLSGRANTQVWTHSMTLKENTTIFNNNYYITVIHLTPRHELMVEQIFSTRHRTGRPCAASFVLSKISNTKFLRKVWLLFDKIECPKVKQNRQTDKCAARRHGSSYASTHLITMLYL